MTSQALGDAIRRAATGIEIRGVNLSYGKTHVLKDVNLSIRAGEFFAFLGPSGCGKTTLLRLIAGFNIAQTGSVEVAGSDISALPPWKRDVGMVFQSYALWPHMSVAKNVAFGLEERRLPKDEIRQRVEEALDLVNLRHLAERRPSQLSGGQQQRVALARTIAVRPKILLLDEPLSNLDARMRVQVRRELRDLQQELGITTIFVTHDQEEANTICDRIAVMNDGIVQQVGTPMELYDRPANLFVAGFLGTANILEGTIADGKFRLPDGESLPAGKTRLSGPAKAVFRPQNARISAASKTSGVSTALPGTITHFEFLGAAVRYSVKIGASEILVDVPHQAALPVISAGTPATIMIDDDQILYFA